MFNVIKTKDDIENFLEKTNSLHDGYIIGVQYTNGGVTKTDYGYSFHSEQTELIIRVLVTSIFDSIVEIKFENLLEWQIKDNQWDITDSSVIVDENGSIIWLDDVYTTVDEMKKGSYVIAKTMKWRILGGRFYRVR